MHFFKRRKYNYLAYLFLCFPLLNAKTVKIEEILLSGDITNPDNEISGMDWYQGLLFMIPENLNKFIYAIPKIELDNYFLSTNPIPIIPRKIRLKTPNYNNLINGFDGFEAIAFYKDNVFLSIEAKSNNHMKGFIAWGTSDPLTQEIFIPLDNLIEIETPIQIDNMSYESIIANGNDLILLYEANGVNLQKSPEHKVFSIIEFSTSKIISSNIEYRITDATKIDSNGKFWCINYLWPGDKIKLKPHKEFYLNEIEKNNNYKQIERLIEFELKNGKILLTENEPINFELENDISRNWEGIVRYGKDSFLIVTDKYPRMILGMVKK